MQALFSIGATGFEAGSTVNLCSTVSTPGAVTTCRFGRNDDGDTVEGGPNAGFIIATGSLNGILQSSSVLLTTLVGEGQQVVHVEARELDSDPHVASAFRDILVDSVPPSVQSASFTGNSSANDASGIIRLNATEGIPNGSALRVALNLGVTGLENDRTVTVLSDGDTIGSAAISENAVTFNLDISAGTHTLTFAMTDAAGNTNGAATDVIDSLSVEVDITQDSASLAPAQQSPYTALAGTTSATELTLSESYGIVVTVGDTSGDGTVTLSRFAGPAGGTATASVSSTLNEGQSSQTFSGFKLLQGFNYLEATYTDRAGNVTRTERQLYSADFVGPTLTLGVRTAAAAVQSCNDFGSACLADTLPLGSGEDRIRLDAAATTPTCGGSSCSTAGTDLFYSLSQCVNSDASLETCPVSVTLESRVATGSSASDWATVDNGVFSSGEATSTSITSDPRFEPGLTRELRISAQDSNGNLSHSNSVFLTLNYTGVAVVVERLDSAGAATGDLLANDRYFGTAESTLAASTGRFMTNFRARLSAFGDAVPTSTRLIVDSTSGSESYEQPVLGEGTYSDFVGVELWVATNPASPTTNTITIETMCGVDPCGPRMYSGVVADIAAPTYQFDRCSLCTLNVPLESTGCPAACTGDSDSDAGANIKAYTGATGTFASWNLALDTDHDGSNGFNAPTLAVKLGGVENDQSVRLNTDVGSVGGNVVASSGCPTAATCSATFASLTASNLSGVETRRISVSFTDKAGNAAVPLAIRGSSTTESIYARTDVLAPSGITPTVCIGESTTPTAAADAATVEAAACASVCAATSSCDRLAAKASLRWSVPGDDNGSGTTAPSGYIIGAAALGIPYLQAGGGTVTYTACSDITADGPFEVTVAAPTPLQTTGGNEQVAVPGLFPHRDYCFGVFAIDDVGNRSPAGSFVARRKIPLLTAPDIQAFDGVNRDDATTAGVFYTDASASNTFGITLKTLPDLDGDGRDDFAVTQFTPTGKVLVFLSGTTGGINTPSITITEPEIAPSAAFGSAVAGGDFNGDDLNDLVICDTNLTTSNFAEAGEGGGAIFIYYGVPSTAIARTANNGTDPQLPSLKPDVTLLGRAGQHLCDNVEMANVDGIAGIDIVATTSDVLEGETTPRVYGLRGGSSRFPAIANYKTYLDLDADTAALGGPDFDIHRNSSGVANFPWLLSVGDFDGDGISEVAISDPNTDTQCTDCGEVYVYRGGTTLSGHVAPPATAAASVATTVRLTATASQRFGYTMTTVHRPRASDSADWLLIGTALTQVVVFKGGTASFLDATYPLAASDQYTYLDNTLWDGTVSARFGRSLGDVGNFDGQTGTEIVVGPGFPSSGTTFSSIVFSFDQANDKFVKRAILSGGIAFGSALAGVRGFYPDESDDRAQLVVVKRGPAQLFLFR